MGRSLRPSVIVARQLLWISPDRYTFHCLETTEVPRSIVGVRRSAFCSRFVASSTEHIVCMVHTQCTHTHSMVHTHT